MHASLPRLSVALLTLWIGLFGTAPRAAAIAVIPPTFTALVAGSDAIVRGTVSAVESRWVDNPGHHHVIKTFVTLKIEATAKGEDAKTLTLTFLGGRIGRDTMEVGGMPTFRPGQRGWFFIQGNGRVFCPLHYANHGAYLIVRDPADGREQVTRLNGAPLHSTAEVGAPLTAPAMGATVVPVRGLTSAEFGDAVTLELRRINLQRAQQP